MLDAERARRLLAYDELTGHFRWVATDCRAGCATTNGYIVIGVDGKLFLAHRLAWLWMTGSWPAVLVDHKNRKKNDNRWDNLREATVSQNVANSGARSTSGSGVKGVSWCSSTKKWRATITVNGKQRSLGRHDELESAAASYARAASGVFGEFAATELGVTFYELEAA